MNNVRKKNLFLWTLRGKPYWILSSCSLALLVLAFGVNAI